jgi:CheY-like chemotaxis protein
LLAGRKLLLADDSVTIQKVIELTFADEGVRVVAFGNGQDAIDSLEEIAPDIVLADVFMPAKNGYEVCEYVKQNEKLRHVPVMLLVGSFEPFDEAEARRVGADDILTKPFQSIRRLIDRVGALVTSPPIQPEVVTAELPQNGDKPNGSNGEAKLNTEELEVTTADTRPLHEVSEERHETLEFSRPVDVSEPEVREEKMETVTELQADSGDVLLDLGEFEHADVVDSDDFVLDLEDTLEGDFVVNEPAPMRAFVEPEVSETMPSSVGQSYSYQPEIQAASYSAVEEVAYEDQVHEVVSETESKYDTAPIPAPIPVMAEPEPVAQAMPVSSAASDNLSPQLIDAIARRVVEMMSAKVVQDIAWEVVPDLAELLIKKHLEEKESQAK